MNYSAIAVTISACALVVTLIGTGANIYFARRRDTVQDEDALTLRIARSKAVETEMKAVAESTCRTSFQGRGPWVKELAAEVFNDKLLLLQNQRVFVTSDALRPEIDAIKATVNSLTSAVRTLESSVNSSLEAAAEAGAVKAIIRVKREGLL